MGQQVDVHVLSRSGDPVAGTVVKIDIKGIWKGGTLDATTDTDGHAEFETAADYEHGRQLRICVRREWFGPYDLTDGSFTVTLS